LPPLEFILKNELHTITVEIKLMSELDHVLVIKLLDMFKIKIKDTEKDEFYLIMEKFD
jgi:hypothetical protein